MNCSLFYPHSPKREMDIEGIIYVFGNEPFTHLAIKNDDGEIWVIDDSQKSQFLPFQNKRIKARVVIQNKKFKNSYIILIKRYTFLK